MLPWKELWDVLSLRAGYNAQIVLLGAGFLGIAAGVVGSFLLLRKRALLGDALAHSALPGLALAFILGETYFHIGKNLFILLSGAALSAVCGTICVQIISRKTRLDEDSAIGIVLSTFFGAGVVLMSVVQSMGTGDEAGLNTFIYGQTAGMLQRDAVVNLIAALIACAISIASFKEFTLVCFDREFADVQGWSVSRIDFILMVLVILITVIGLQTVGIIMIVALLIVPPSAARFWTENLKTMTLLSAAIGGWSCFLGAGFSTVMPHLPAGSVIILTSCVFFVVSLLFAPRRGVLASTLRQIKMQLRIVAEHILRAIYEELEKREQEFDRALVLSDLKWSRIGNKLLVRIVFEILNSKRLIKFSDDKAAVSLTESGITEALRLTRNHRLWEEFIARYGDIASSHVDYSADRVEHVLGPEYIVELEEALLKKGVKADTILQPKSIHKLEGQVDE